MDSQKIVTTSEGQVVVFKCISCIVDFPQLKDLKEHHKSDWHHYNLKRKLAELGPVTEEVFNKKLEQLTSRPQAIKGSSHLKNAQNPKQIETQERRSSPRHTKLESYESACQSLFDFHISESIEKNIGYMQDNFSFFFLDPEYITDLSAILKYLGMLVYEEHVCLGCQRKFKSVQAVHNHMTSSGHISLADEVEADCHEQFYDYSKSYLKLNGKDEDLVQDDDWETDDENNSSPSEELLDVFLQARGYKRACLTDTGNLRLPNGIEVPHREVAYVYKQRLPLRHSNNDDIEDGKKKDILQAKRIQKKIIVHQVPLFRKREAYWLKLGQRTNKLQHNILRSTKYFI